jgi:hypothetical protein
MPYKAHEARRHKIPRARYKVTNWPDCGTARSSWLFTCGAL